MTQKLTPVIKKVYEPTRGSLGLILPKSFTQHCGLSDQCHVQVELEGKNILIRKMPLLPSRKKER